MAWFKVDDGFPTHPKVLRIPRAQRLAAIGLWTIAGAWCSKHLTDGAVPAFMLEEWGADVSHGTALVDVGLWVETEDGWRFHDWDKSQPSRAEVLASREAERVRKENYRKARAEKSGQSPGNVPSGVPVGQRRVSGHPDPSNPDPTRPGSKDPHEGAASRGTRIRDDWKPSELLIEWARAKAPSVNLDVESEKFVNYWAAKAGAAARKVSWDRTWKNWMLDQHERNVNRGWKPTGGGSSWDGIPTVRADEL